MSRARGVNAVRWIMANRLAVLGLVARSKHLIDRRGEIIQSGARDDDRISPAMRLLGDTEEFPALIFAEFEVKPLPFDLNFPRLENAVHLPSLTNTCAGMEEEFA